MATLSSPKRVHAVAIDRTPARTPVKSTEEIENEDTAKAGQRRSATSDLHNSREEKVYVAIGLNREQRVA